MAGGGRKCLLADRASMISLRDPSSFLTKTIPAYSLGDNVNVSNPDFFISRTKPKYSVESISTPDPYTNQADQVCRATIEFRQLTTTCAVPYHPDGLEPCPTVYSSTEEHQQRWKDERLESAGMMRDTLAQYLQRRTAIHRRERRHASQEAK